MIQPYFEPLLRKFEENRDPARALQMKKYLKDQYEFYGIPTPARRALISAHINEHGLPDWLKIDTIARNFWEMNEREWQFTLLDLMNRMKKKLNPDHLSLLEYLITTKSWWDTVDGLSAWLAGELFKHYPDRIPDTTRKWMDSGNIWLQRSCLLFQLKYKKDTDLDLLFSFIDELSLHKSFWIRKAIGWTLREYSKTNSQIVEKFVAAHPELSGLSKREALKQIMRTKAEGIKN